MVARLPHSAFTNLGRSSMPLHYLDIGAKKVPSLTKMRGTGQIIILSCFNISNNPFSICEALYIPRSAKIKFASFELVKHNQRISMHGQFYNIVAI